MLKNSDYLNQFGFVMKNSADGGGREVPQLWKIDGVSQILEGFAKDLTENSAVNLR